MQPGTWMVFGSTDTDTSVTVTAAGTAEGITRVGGTAASGMPPRFPYVLVKATDIQQKLPWRNGFLTYHQLPSGFLPTISAVCPGFKTTTTAQPVPGPDRQLRG